MLPTNSGRGGSLSLILAGILFFVIFYFISISTFDRAPEKFPLSQISPLRRWSNRRYHKGPLGYEMRGNGPISDVCKMFSYQRYVRAENLTELRRLGKNALPGDMVR